MYANSNFNQKQNKHDLDNLILNKVPISLIARKVGKSASEISLYIINGFRNEHPEFYQKEYYRLAVELDDALKEEKVKSKKRYF